MKDKGGREAKKPKQAKPKTIAANPQMTAEQKAKKKAK